MGNIKLRPCCETVVVQLGTNYLLTKCEVCMGNIKLRLCCIDRLAIAMP